LEMGLPTESAARTIRQIQNFDFRRKMRSIENGGGEWTAAISSPSPRRDRRSADSRPDNHYGRCSALLKAFGYRAEHEAPPLFMATAQSITRQIGVTQCHEGPSPFCSARATPLTLSRVASETRGCSMREGRYNVTQRP